MLPRPHRLADRSQGEWRCRGDLGRQRVRLGAHDVAVDQRIAEPDRSGLFSLDPSSGKEQIVRVLLTDDGGQRDRQAEDVMESEAGEVGREPRLGTGNPKVGQTRQTEARTDGGTLDGRHDRGLDGEQPDRLPVQKIRAHGPAIGRTPGKVGARAEVLAFGAQQDGPARNQLVECGICVTQCFDHVRLEEVLGWPVDLDGRDEGVVDGRCHISKTLVEHGCPPDGPTATVLGECPCTLIRLRHPIQMRRVT